MVSEGELTVSPPFGLPPDCALTTTRRRASQWQVTGTPHLQTSVPSLTYQSKSASCLFSPVPAKLFRVSTYLFSLYISTCICRLMGQRPLPRARSGSWCLSKTSCWGAPSR